MTEKVTNGYSAKQVGNYFLSKYKNITPLKLQKLVYIAHGWHMAFHGPENPLVSDENVEAWKHGPVYPSLYHHFKDFGNLPINRLAEKIAIVDQEKGLLNSPYKRVIPQINSDDNETMDLLNRVWEVYGEYSGTYLSNLCHQPGTPWDHNKEKNKIRNAHIPNKEIATHYFNKLKNNYENG